MEDKVYVVWWNNGEPYEDNCQDIDIIFRTRKEAEKYLDDRFDRFATYSWDYKNQTRVPDHMWRAKLNKEPYICVKGFDKCEDCSIYEDWINAEEETETPCEEYDQVSMNYPDPYQNDVYAIREFTIGREY